MNEAMELSARVANRDRLINLARGYWGDSDPAFTNRFVHYSYRIPLDKLILPGELA